MRGSFRLWKETKTPTKEQAQHVLFNTSQFIYKPRLSQSATEKEQKVSDRALINYDSNDPIQSKEV